MRTAVYNHIRSYIDNKDFFPLKSAKFKELPSMLLTGMEYSDCAFIMAEKLQRNETTQIKGVLMKEWNEITSWIYIWIE